MGGGGGARRGRRCLSVWSPTPRSDGSVPEMHTLGTIVMILAYVSRQSAAGVQAADTVTAEAAGGGGGGASPMNETLRAAAARIPGFFIGSQFKGAQISDSSMPRYRRTHSEQYSLSTVGNGCKWQATHRSSIGLNLTSCVAAKRYADSVGQKFRGHNLCWGNDNPEWLLDAGRQNPAQLQVILQEHIKGVMQGVAQQTGSAPLAWDVVNEACANNIAANGSFFKHVEPWSALPHYVDVAFYAARAADPTNATQLFYNDFGAEEAGSDKSETVFKMVSSMLARGVPLDGVGLQMHKSIGESAPSEAKVSTNIQRLGNLGLKVHITEMDVKCPDPCGAESQQAQAEIYASMLRACLANAGVCTSFESWGFTDAVTWLKGSRCATKDCHPLPFDERYLPKPAAAAMLRVLQEHAATHT